jgi:protoporphyrinogen/coproporphyrinogen III oxidase
VLSWRGKMRTAMELALPRRRQVGDESIGAFVARRLGRELLERIAQPLVSTIYAADPSTISLAATMPRFLEMERRDGSIIRALRRAAASDRGGVASGPRWSLFVTPAGGMMDLVDALADHLPPAAPRLRCRVTSLARATGLCPWRVELAGGTAVCADGVIVALPGPSASRVVENIDGDLSRLLAAIPYASSAIVTLGYRAADIGHPLDGFGFVVPRAEGRTILAGTFSSIKFPGRAPDGHVLLRVFIGGERQASLLDEDDRRLVAAAEREIDDLLAATAPPRLTRVHRHPDAMPQYLVGHLERAAAIRAQAARHQGLVLAGNALEGIGIPDCIHSGEQAAERMLEALCGDVPARPCSAGTSRVVPLGSP